MGVSVRLSRNVRVYLPFWVAIPAWLLIAAVYVIAFMIYGVFWLLVQGGIGLVWLLQQGGIGLIRLSDARKVRRAAPAVRGLQDVAAAGAASASIAGRWAGPVRNVKRTGRSLEFQVLDPSRPPNASFVIPQPRRYRNLSTLADGDVVELVMNESGHDVRVHIVRRADGSTPTLAHAVAPAAAAPPEPTVASTSAPVEVQRPTWPRVRIDGPGRPWQRDWAVWVLILALPTIIVGLVIYSALGLVGKDIGTVLVDVPLLLAVPAALITLLVRWLRRWRGSRTRNAA